MSFDMSVVRGAVDPLRRLQVRVRRFLVRHPSVYWMAVAALTTATVAVVVRHGDEVDEARASWGATAPVLVARIDAAPGDPLPVDRRDLPAAMVPPGAVPADGDSGGLVARQRVGTGEIVTAADIAATSDAMALVPTGWLAVPLTEATRSGARIGDRVELASGGFVLADDAIVVGVDEGTVLVAVPTDVAPLVPAAADTDGVTLLLRP